MRKIEFNQTDKNFITYILKTVSEGLEEKTIEKDLSREEWLEFVKEINKITTKFEEAIDQKVMIFTDDEMDMLCELLQIFVNIISSEFKNNNTDVWEYANAIALFASIEKTISDTRFELFKEEE